MMSIKELLLESYGALCCCVLPALFFLLRRTEWGGRGRALLFLLFLGYLAAVFSITGAGTLYDLLYRDFFLSFNQINPVPFHSPFLSEGYLLNILLFVPFGLFAVLLWPGRGHAVLTVCWGFLFSLAIECSQLFNNRFTDIDDLSANTLGALVGVLLALGLRLLFGRGRHTQARPALAPVLFFAAAFLGRFLLFDELRAAGLLYGF